MKCEDCIEWEYFEGYGYGCYCMKTMTPIDADKCEYYADKLAITTPNTIFDKAESEDKESEE